VLNRHPAVRESRVYGAAHPHLGEVIEAEVALRSAIKPGVLRDFCRAYVSADKIPSRIHVVHSVARTAVTGKVRRPATLPVA
jgi:acyl-CoA synthetase (AMP-forming)/AMP-acid ligase II